ncbi:Poly(U)-specific endoribonuclease like protein [Dufourea novaeangliae]|uniref:Poly(U)-specific endoribonuclease like protein n=1 Tax=Dufourea novaeangliae TaxID=178035 RepID=A0A154P845_DUFNO|nr:Poly(U)-specific endoribonuclease like protein [Dufourea novaeangliae]
MRFKTFFLVLLLVISAIDSINAKWRSSGRSSKPSSHSYGRSSSSHRTSYGGSSSHGSSSGSHTTAYGSYGSSTNSKPVSHGPTSISRTPTGFGTSTGGSSISRPSSGQVPHQQNKDTNTNFLNAEGGGAKRPVGTSYPASVYSTIGQNGGVKPGVTTERKQTSSPYQPSAPKEQVVHPVGVHQNQGSNTPYTPGQTNPSWSNPYLGTNRPSTPRPTHYPWSHQHGSDSRITVPTQTNPPWSNPYTGLNRPAAPGSQPTPIGFKDHVYPQTHPTQMGSHYSPPPFGGQSAYPHSGPPSSPWSVPSYHTPTYQPSSMPMGNPYTVHPSGGVHSAAGPAYYPQQPHVFAQPAAQPFIPGQTVIMVPGQQDSGRGIGQMVKEALVFSTINAGVNRLINPHTHHYVESKPDTNPSTTTHITYNNQYFNTLPGVNVSSNMYNTNVPNNGVSSSVSGSTNGNDGTMFGGSTTIGNAAVPTAQSSLSGTSSNENSTTNSSNVDNTFFYRISDNELLQITEDLFKKSLNISKYIKLNLQNRATSPNITDEAAQPLFEVEPTLLDYPSIYVTQALYDSYEHDSQKKFNRTQEIREHENLLMDTFLNTNVMASAMQWLADREFIDPDDFERKDVLRRIWFTMFSGSTCGFERIFESENYGTAIIGAQDWLYFEKQEAKKRINYMGYVDKLNLGTTASLLKLNFEMDGLVRPNATIFVGTMPELEMSLYTICFYARPNSLCPVSLGGTKFNIYTHSFTYYGNEVIDLGLPVF